MKLTTWIWRLALGVVALFILIQLLPIGRNHTNPAVIQNAPWRTPAAEQIARRACYDCHSNETVWPWYSNVAPLSWRIQNHVDEGREKLNFSAWGRGEYEPDEVAETVRQGYMPPSDYLILHPDARLSPADIETLISGLP